MLDFCGQDCCKLDAGGRLKLGQHFINDFIARCDGRVVMYCLPEGALALYPEAVFEEMRRREREGVERAASSLLARRSMRRFGALSRPDQITRQGRVSIPPTFRDYAMLKPGEEVYVVGIEIGVEIWNSDRWREEMNAINEFNQEKGEREIAAELSKSEV